MSTRQKSDSFTAVVHTLGTRRAPSRIALLGDKTVRPESAQHIIDFPGGAIEVTRTSDGNYWAHIIVNRGQALDIWDGFGAANGEIIDGRIDCDAGVIAIPDIASLAQIAVLIRPLAPTLKESLTVHEERLP